MSTQRVFISHSHEDRNIALIIESVLKKQGAETFLDQNIIEVGNVLPARLEDGIKWCSKFLLLWSSNAAGSVWVEREWNMAYDLRKSIIPYRLDFYPFPEELEDRVYVEAEDKNRAHAGLLAAVFGRDFKPQDPTTMFPGRWELAISDPHHANAKFIFSIELRRNGQIQGTGKLNRAAVDAILQDTLGKLGPALYIDPTAMEAAQLGASSMRPIYESLRLSVLGNWSYKMAIGELSIDSTINSSLGTTGQFSLRMVVNADRIAGDLNGTCMFNALGTGGAMAAPVTLRRTD